MIEEEVEGNWNGCCCSEHLVHSYEEEEEEETTNLDDCGRPSSADGLTSYYRAPVRRYWNFFHSQSSYIRTAADARVVRSRRRKRNGSGRRTRPPSTIFVFIICWLCIIRSSSGIVENTLDMLRDEPGVSPAQISEKIIQCNESKLCTSVNDNVPSPVCGSDGRTYNSVCEIKKAICHGSPVKEKYRGPCSDKSKCPLERAFQQELSEQNNRTAQFIPECELDGSYSTVQCHTLGYCWCSTSNGRPVPGTAVQFKRPNCPPQGKVGRRSSRRRLGTRRRVCSTADRSTFSSNLIKLFRSEFEQDPQNKRRSTDAVSVTDRVIDWKFNNLDTDHNNKITRKEISVLKKLTENLVQPKACARRFTKYCDLDADKKISRSEWSVCLGVDINISFRLLLSLNTDRQQAFAMMNDRASQQQSNASMSGLQNPALWQDSDKEDSGFSILKEKPVVHPESQEEEKTDCKSRKQVAIDEQSRNPGAHVYIPTCRLTDEKIYDVVQCHAGFCWCVVPETNRPVKNTATKNVRPNCNNLTKIVNEFKGCNNTKKRQFYLRLYSTLESSMIASGKGDYADEISRKEMVVRWQFSQLDKNKNEKLDRREWRDYRNELKSWKGVRKCGRNFLRFCDQDSDKRITMAEWLDCTVTVPSRQSTVRREGINPFIKILQPD